VPGDRDSDARRPEPAAVAAALAVVPGVLSSSMATGPDGQPRGVRIVLEDAADEVEVAALAHRILRLQFGVGLDPGHIQLVEVPVGDDPHEPLPDEPLPRLRLVDEDRRQVLEIGSEVAPLLAGIDAEVGRYGTDVLESAVRHPAGAGPVPSGDEVVDVTAEAPRLEIVDLSMEADGAGALCRVALRRAGREHVGTATVGPGEGGEHRAVAEATAYAVSHALDGMTRLEVEAASVVPAGALQVAVVQVGWWSGERYERLLGAAEVRDDARRTIIRATLDAVNRRLAVTLDR
jgi:hypothetical protein